MKNNEMEKEKFKDLARDMKPVIKNMEEVFKKHDIECLSSLTVSTDGYFNFRIHDSDWEFKRADSNSKLVISIHITEEV